MRGGLDTRWRLALWAGAWLAGVAAQLLQSALWPAPAYAVLAAAGAGVAAAALVRRAPAAVLALALALAALAFGSTGGRAALRLAEQLPAALEGRDLVLTGVIDSLPRVSMQGTRFEFEIEHAELDGVSVAVPRRVVLGWYRGFDAGALLAAPQVDLQAGDRWRLTARLSRPHGTLNPHGFDYELWLFERGLRATGYVRAGTGAGEAPQQLGRSRSGSILRLRQALRERIAERVPDARTAGVLAALVVGDQGAIERADWDLFRATGVAHLMAISGLHITMFAWLAAALVQALWRRVPRLLLWVPAPQAGRWCGLGLAALYAALAGWGVPAQRTLAMLAVVVLLRSLGWRWPAPLVLAAAAVAVTLADPWALLQPGFWLSFAAVGLLMGSQAVTGQAPAATGLARRFVAALRAGVRTQVVATLGLAPLTLLFFQQVSVVGFVANLVAIPLVTLAVTPLALAGVLLPAAWPAAAALVQALSAYLEALAAWPGAVWAVPAAPGWAAAAGLLGGALMVLPLPRRVRALGAALLLPLLWPAVPVPAAGRFELVALDVGQGTAVLLRTRQHLLVYDTGPSYSPEADAGDRVLLPLLAARGERRVHRLVLSHRDTDHVGGAASLLARLPVDELWSSLEAGHPLRAAALPQRACAAGQRWQWDGVQFELLHPPADAPGGKPNSRSCVLRVQDGQGASVLLSGDIEAAQEGALVIGPRGAPPPLLRSTVLMVPHHGSRTSSTAAFLDAVAPRIGFVQAAYRSRFGHPAPDVLARYAERGIAVVRSDRCGAWTWRGSGPGECERDGRRRYWHHRP